MTDTKAPTVAASKTAAPAKAKPIHSNNPPRGLNEPPADAIADEPAAGDLQRHIADRFAAEADAGHRGKKDDPTPRENYTLAGVTSDAQVPETVVVTPTD